MKPERPGGLVLGVAGEGRGCARFACIRREKQTERVTAWFSAVVLLLLLLATLLHDYRRFGLLFLTFLLESHISRVSVIRCQNRPFPFLPPLHFLLLFLLLPLSGVFLLSYPH